MAIQFGTVDGLVNISQDPILCFVKGIDEFVTQGGPAYANREGLSYGAAFQRFVEPVYIDKTKPYTLLSVKRPVLTRSGAEQSPARGTFCKKMGLLKIDESIGLFEITPIGKAILNSEISIEEYAFILLSKMGIFKDGEYVGNLLNYITKYFQSHATISQNSLEKDIKLTYNDPIIVKTRLDIIINSLVATGLFTKVTSDIFVLSGTGEAELLVDYNKRSNQIGKAKIDTSKEYSEYIGNLEYGGIFDILTYNNIDIYSRFFPNLFKYMRSDKNYKSLQQIFYGAPGTGKSNTIKREVDEKGKLNFRTTFHPDSDYSTFVGCYKPKMKRSTITKDGVTTTEEKIVYNFEPQAFTNAYIQAWSTKEDVYLIVEEINRGNCAQIFGDLFQLLDRKNGESEYPVDADSALADYLQTALENSKRDDIPAEVKNGTKLKLPSNLYIWATMNTSDQSLFPIDSAFKRRWDWKYIPIDTKKEQWSIAVDEESYSWTSFLDIVNERVFKATSSEDKQLGFYFCKAQNNAISAETFVSKVLFYLWNDVFKDYDEGDSIFKDTEGKQLPFSNFYNTDGSVNNTMLKELLTALRIEKTVNSDASTLTTEEVEEDEDGNAPSSVGKNYDKYSVNGIGRYGKNRLATESVKKYIELNPFMSAEEVLANWKSLGVIVPHFIESKEEYDARTDNSKRSYEIPCGDTVIYVAHNGYGSNGKVDELMKAVNKTNWGLALAKVAA